MAPTPSEAARRLLPHAVAFAVGLVLVFVSATSYLTHAYMRANPAVGTVSTSPGYESVTLLRFVAGAVLAFLATGVAGYRICEDTSRAG